MRVPTIQSPGLTEDPEDVSSPRLGHELVLEDAAVEGLDWSNQSAGNVRLNGIVARHGDFTGTRLPKCSISDTRLEKCLIAGVIIEDGGLHRLVVAGAQGAGLTITTSVLRDVHFKDCRLNLANFRFSKLKNIIFEDCVLEEADFAYARLEGVAFRNCNLAKSQFSDAKLARVDLRTSDLDGLGGVLSLRGATIDELQMMQLARSIVAETGLEVL